jgi:hypothetical protein
VGKAKSKTGKPTISKAVSAIEAIKTIIEADKENKWVLASAVRCRLALNQRKLLPVYEEYVNASNALVAKLGTKETKKETVDGVEKEVETGRYVISRASPNWTEYVDEITELLNSEVDVELSPIAPFELAGVTEKEYSDPNADPKRQNQVPTDLIATLYEVGLLKE